MVPALVFFAFAVIGTSLGDIHQVPAFPRRDVCRERIQKPQWKNRQDLSVDLNTATRAFAETFLDTTNPNFFANGVIIGRDTFTPLSAKQWKVTQVTDDGERFTIVETVLASSPTCLVVRAERTRERDGATIDFEFAVDLDTREGKDQAYLGHEMLSCEPRFKIPGALRNFMCNESNVFRFHLTHIKRFACLLELFPFAFRAQICRTLQAGVPPAGVKPLH